MLWSREVEELICDKCPHYTGRQPPPNTACPGVETCKKIAANHGTPITLVPARKESQDAGR